MSAELTYKEVEEHNSKKDLYLVVHDKVYNATSFVDEHPYVETILQFPIKGDPLPILLLARLTFRIPGEVKKSC